MFWGWDVWKIFTLCTLLKCYGCFLDLVRTWGFHWRGCTSASSSFKNSLGNTWDNHMKGMEGKKKHRWTVFTSVHFLSDSLIHLSSVCPCSSRNAVASFRKALRRTWHLFQTGICQIQSVFRPETRPGFLELVSPEQEHPRCLHLSGMSHLSKHHIHARFFSKPSTFEHRKSSQKYLAR